MVWVAWSLFKRCKASCPFIPGKCKSSKIKSGLVCRASSIAGSARVSPSSSTCGYSASTWRTNSKFARLSSIYRILKALVGRPTRTSVLPFRVKRFIGLSVTGNSNQKVLPCPTVLSTPIFPPISSTRRLDKARPRPVPSTSLVSAPSRSKGLKSCSSLSGGMPGPVSITEMRRR